MRRSILIFVLGLVTLAGFGQTPRNIAKEAIPVSMIQVTYAAQFPAFDTKTNYGFTNTIGGSFIYKAKSNCTVYNKY